MNPSIIMQNYLFILVIIVCWCAPIASQEYDSTQSNQTVTVFDKEVEYTGWHGAHENPSNLKEIRIGLFLPIKPDDKNNSPFQKAAASRGRQPELPPATGFRKTH